MQNVAELLLRAEQHLERGELDEAALLFDEAHDQNPRSPNGALGMARVALALGQKDEAAQILEKVLHRFPGHARALELRSVAF